MTSKTTIVILFFLVSIVAEAQLTNVDSLLKTLEGQTSKNDKLNKSMDVLDILYRGGYNEQALSLGENALALANELNDRFAIARVNNRMGTIYSNIGDENEALSYFNLSMAYFSNVENSYWLGILYNNMGNSYRSLGYDAKAFDHYLKSMEICREIGDFEGEGYALKNIGMLYEMQGWYDKSLQYHLQALKIREKSNRKALPASSYMNVGVAYIGLKEYDSALVYLMKAKEIAKTSFGELTDQVLEKIGNVYERQGRLNEAVLAYEEGLIAAERTQKFRVKAWLLRNLARIRIQQNRLVEAEEYIAQQKHLVDSLSLGNESAEYYGLQYDLFIKKGQELEALRNFVIKSQIEDSLFRISNAEEVVFQGNALEILEKENEVALTKANQKYQRNTFIGIVGFLVIAIVGLFLYLHQTKLINTQLKLQKEEIATKNLQLESKSEEIEDQIRETRKRNRELSETLQMLRKTQQQLIEAEKMGSISVLTAGLAHELNNPLSYIGGIAHPLRLDLEEIKSLIDQDKLKDSEYLFEEIELLLGNLKSGVAKASDIIKSLISISPNAPQAANQEAFNISEILRSTTKLVQKSTTNVKLTQDIKEDLHVSGNRIELNQVIVNLLKNAIDAAENRPMAEVLVQADLINNHVVLRITDNGVGIKGSDMGRIFEPFFTTKDPNRGTGLGLYIAYSIIGKHEGKIEVESTINEGTTFTVTFPRAQMVEAASKPMAGSEK